MESSLPMTLTRTWFRRLLLLSIAANVASALIGEGQVSATLKLAYEAEPNPWTGHLWTIMVLTASYTVVVVAGTVGLYRFRQWGRSVALWSTLVGFVA